MTLQALLAKEAGDLEEATSVAAPDGGIAWSRGTEVFAVVSGDGAGAEFRLDAAVAAAATRTPDTVASARGPGWVLFRPASLDARGADRATAWFRSAYRRGNGR